MGLLDELGKIDDNRNDAVEETKKKILNYIEIALTKAAEETYNKIEALIKEKAAKFEFQKANGHKVIEGEFYLSYLSAIYNRRQKGESWNWVEDEILVKDNGITEITSDSDDLFFTRKDLFADFIKENELIQKYSSICFWLYKWDFRIEEPFLKFLSRYKVYARPILTKYGNFYFSKLNEICKSNGVIATPMVVNNRSKRLNINEPFLYLENTSRDYAYRFVERVERESKTINPEDYLLTGSRLFINYKVIYD